MQDWTIYDTNDENVSVAYKQLDGSNVYTIRGAMTMKVEENGLDLFYKAQECGYDDVYIQEMEKSSTCTEIRIHKLIDNDHQMIYQTQKSGFFILSPRDFTNIKSRWKKTNYKYENVEYKKIVGTLAYTVQDDHPLNVITKEKHVRGNVENYGYVLSQTEEQEKNGEMQVCYILALDPCGSIPQWIVNQFAPSKGMSVKKFPETWEKIKETVEERKQNDWKKDHKPLFEPHPKLMYVEEQE